MLKRLGIILFLFFLSMLAGLAQTTKTWTLKECLDYALEHNVDIKKTLLAVNENEIDVRESKWAFVPSISTSTSGSGGMGRVLDPTTYEFVQTSYMANTNTSLSGNITLFEGGKKIHALQKAKIGLQASLMSVESLRYNLRMNVIAAYLDVLCANEQHKSTKFTVSKLESQLERSKVLLEAGVITESDVLQLNSQLFSAKNDVSAAVNAYDVARLKLCNLLEIEDYSSFMVAQLDGDYSPMLINVNDAIENAPDFRKAEIDLRMSNKNVQLLKSALWPSLSLSLGYGTNYSDQRKKIIINPDGTTTNEPYPFFQQYADNANAFATLTLNIPILTGLRANGNLKRAKIQSHNAECELANVKKNLRTKIVQAQIDLNTAIDKYNSALEQLRYAEAAEGQLCDKYNLGAVDFNSWNTAVVELALAKYNLSDAKYSLLLKRQILKVYGGE